jgi:glutamate racemase
MKVKVKFLRGVVSTIGTFVIDQIEEIEDKHVVSNWVENELIEIVEEMEEKPKAKKKVVKKEVVKKDDK